jgi:hypothetical protein
MTVYDTCINQFYDNPSDLCWDLACAINVEIKRLIDAGCYKYVIYCLKKEKCAMTVYENKTDSVEELKI